MTLSINNSAYHQIKELEPVVLQKPKATIFTLQHIHVETEPARKAIFLKTISGVLNTWRDIMKDRLRATEAMQLSEEHFTSDYTVATGYDNLVESTDDNIQELAKKPANKNRHVMVLTDLEGQIQAVATVKEKMDRIEVDTLISAPWNVPMQSKVHDEHRPLVAYGAGKTMIRQVYELAREKNKAKLELRPIKTARSFYVDTLKMVAKDGDIAVHFPVTWENCPESLDVPSGNLLTRPE